MEPCHSGRINLESLKQDHKGYFNKSCFSIVHLRHYSSSLIDLTTKKKISAKVLKKLLEKRIMITKKLNSYTVCNECVKSVCDSEETVETSGDEDSDIAEEVSDAQILTFLELGRS